MNEISVLLNHINCWHWLALAAILGILDVALGANFILLWCGLTAALVAGLLCLMPSLSWQWQFLVFGVGVLASIVLWKKTINVHTVTDKPHLNRRSHQYLGREFTLDEAIINGRGKVSVDDTTWRVEGDDLAAGTTVRVVDVDGVVLKVEKA